MILNSKRFKLSNDVAILLFSNTQIMWTCRWPLYNILHYYVRACSDWTRKIFSDGRAIDFHIYNIHFFLITKLRPHRVTVVSSFGCNSITAATTTHSRWRQPHGYRAWPTSLTTTMDCALRYIYNRNLKLMQSGFCNIILVGRSSRGKRWDNNFIQNIK